MIPFVSHQLGGRLDARRGVGGRELAGRALQRARQGGGVALVSKVHLGRDCRNFRVWGRTMLLRELSYATTQTAPDPG